jgi:hypothetical protein
LPIVVMTPGKPDSGSTADVRFGSKADMRHPNGDVRFTPMCGRRPDAIGCKSDSSAAGFCFVEADDHAYQIEFHFALIHAAEESKWLPHPCDLDRMRNQMHQPKSKHPYPDRSDNGH